MNLDSLQEQFASSLKQYALPLLLGVAGLIFLGYGLMQFGRPAKPEPDQKDILFEAAHDEHHSANTDQAAVKTQVSPQQQKEITVDIEGAVVKPGVYKLALDSRVQDVLIAAGGLSNDADRLNIAKSLNLAAKVVDGGKIYIPFKGEQVLTSNGSGVAGTSGGLININTASQKDLESLQGIGEVTAAKIIAGRPYATAAELLQKKIVGKKVFDQIKEKVTTY